MKEYTTDKIRNIAMVSHSGAGKTMLADALLFTTGAINRIGSVEDGTTVGDFDDEEKRRGTSLSTALIPIEYRDHKLNVLDSPGYPDFVGEVISALRVADGALVVVDSVAGAQVGTEIAWEYCDQFKLPRFVLINRMHRETANFRAAMESVQRLTEERLISVQLPWGEKSGFKGIIDLLDMKAYPVGGGAGVEIPADMADEAQAARQALIEAAAEGDDTLLEKYLEGGQLSADEILHGLQEVIRHNLFVPVFLADASDQVGMAQLMNAFIILLPSPAEAPAEMAEGAKGEEELKATDTGPLAAYIWKTTADPFVGKISYFRLQSGSLKSDTRVWNQGRGVEERFANLSVLRGKEQISVPVMHAGDLGVVLKLSESETGDTLCDKGHPLILKKPNYPNALYRVAVTPRTQQDATKMGQTLSRICGEDLTLSWHNEPSTKQTILQGMGDQHIDVAIRKAANKFQVGLDIHEPRVPYQEAITKEGSAQYRHKKQTGGAGQFAEVHLRVAPSEDGEFEFANEVVGGAISTNFMPAIEKGVRSVLEKGVIAGYPVKSVRVAVYDGKEHAVDSKPVAFETAGRNAFKEAFRAANPVLLEPIMNVRIVVPEDHMGDVLGDLNTRRARVQGMDSEKGKSVVNAHVPLAEMLRYTTELRSITGGRGVFSMEHDHYETVPHNLAQEIVAQKEVEEEEE
ncbi:MAG: elongation factor G [Anaerolineae bacterium]|nr:MAG: elongation factor G [Anaerolineae bacterium]